MERPAGNLAWGPGAKPRRNPSWPSRHPRPSGENPAKNLTTPTLPHHHQGLRVKAVGALLEQRGIGLLLMDVPRGCLGPCGCPAGLAQADDPPEKGGSSQLPHVFAQGHL